jgi:hypothetical protein
LGYGLALNSAELEVLDRLTKHVAATTTALAKSPGWEIDTTNNFPHGRQSRTECKPPDCPNFGKLPRVGF